MRKITSKMNKPRQRWEQKKVQQTLSSSFLMVAWTNQVTFVHKIWEWSHLIGMAIGWSCTLGMESAPFRLNNHSLNLFISMIDVAMSLKMHFLALIRSIVTDKSRFSTSVVPRYSHALPRIVRSLSALARSSRFERLSWKVTATSKMETQPSS